MKKTYKLLFFTVLITTTAFTSSFAQESESSMDAGVDLVSRYVWRGMSLSTSPAIQPYVEFSSGNFFLGTWGSYSLSPEPYQEVDLYMGYSLGRMTITLNDYFNPVDSLFTTHNYFDWHTESTPHALEAVVEISESDTWPISLSAAVIFFGNDKNDEGKNYYSSYIEAGYHFNIGEQPVQVFMGLTPAEGLYAEKFNLVNMGLSLTKEIPFSEQFTLPISGSFIVNPDAETVFLVASISF
jgi:hypothetical protein